MKKQDWDEAIVEFTSAVHHDFDTPFAHYQLGLAQEKKGDFVAAAKEFQRAAKAMPENKLFREAQDRVTTKIH